LIVIIFVKQESSDIVALISKGKKKEKIMILMTQFPGNQTNFQEIRSISWKITHVNS